MKHKSIIKTKFNGIYSRNNLRKIKDGAYIINLYESKSKWIHWIALYVNNDDNKKFIGIKNIITNIYRTQAHDSIMGGCFCIVFIDFLLKEKRLFECTNFFSPNGYEKNVKIMLKYFQ